MTQASFLERLQEEMAVWQRQRLIGDSQARRILAYYGLVPEEAEEARREGRLATVFAILGAILVGIGVILFVASNWQQMPRLSRVLLLLATLLVTYAVGYWLQHWRNHPRIGAAFIFLGSIVFGANVFLIAQTYHVQANDPMLLAFWAAGALSVAYAADSRPSLYLGILAAVFCYGLQLSAWNTEGLGVGALPALAAFLSLGLLLFSLGELHRSSTLTRALAPAYSQIGLAVVFLTMQAFSFVGFWQSMADSAGSSPSEGSPVTQAQVNWTFATIGALALLLAVVAVQRVGRTKASLVQVVGVIGLEALSLLIVFHPFDDPVAYAISFNVAILAGVLWAVVLGTWTRRESYVNIALVFFVLLVIERYFDFFFTLMDRSVVFIGVGLLLMFGGYMLERYRRRLIRQMVEGEVGHGA